MKHKPLILIITFFLQHGESLRFIKFPSDRKIPDYNVPEPKHFAIVKNSDLKPLPEKFSICSSVSFEYDRDFATFFAIMNDNNSRWMALDVGQQLEEEKYFFWFMTKPFNAKSDKSLDARKQSIIFLLLLIIGTHLKRIICSLYYLVNEC